MSASTLLPFQREGVRLAVEAFAGRILIGDEMGLGKTVQAIAIACHYRAEWPLLVFCPTSMALPWAEELERWCPFLKPGDINLVRSHHNGALRLAPVTIISYGLLTNGKEKERLAAALSSANFGVAIADEAHYLKSKDAQRSQLVLPLLASARRSILLTGTPALNRPVELFTLLHALCPKVPQFATYKAFTERYCDAKVRFVGRGSGARRLDVSGCTNAAELHELMTRHAMVRRLKADVLTELPPKRRQRILLTLGSAGAGSKGAGSAATAELVSLERAMGQMPVGAICHGCVCSASRPLLLRQPAAQLRHCRAPSPLPPPPPPPTAPPRSRPVHRLRAGARRAWAADAALSDVRGPRLGEGARGRRVRPRGAALVPRRPAALLRSPQGDARCGRLGRW